MNRHTSTFSEEKDLVCSGISLPTLYQLLQQLPPDDPDDALDQAESLYDHCCKMPNLHNFKTNCVDDCPQYHEKTATTLPGQMVKKKGRMRMFKTQ